MADPPHVRLVDLVRCVGRAVDLISPRVASHHSRVAYLSAQLADSVPLRPKERTDLIIAAALHDVGALSLRDRLATFEFEMRHATSHCEQGHRLLGGFAPLRGAARLIRHHHLPWRRGAGERFGSNAVKLGSHIIHLADRVDVLLDRRRGVLAQVPFVVESVRSGSGDVFVPELVESLEQLAHQEAFWLGLEDGEKLDAVLQDERLRSPAFLLDGREIVRLTELLSRLIDFRSRFTAVHSSGVAHVAFALACSVELPARTCHHLKVAGYLHDLGKLAVPSEIIDKPSKLDPVERKTMRAHTYYTHRALSAVPGFEEINLWASLHHERLDGAGYPFRRSGAGIPVESRVVAVADVFTALTEDRPYRPGLVPEDAIKTLRSMALDGALDVDVVNVAKTRVVALAEVRRQGQRIGQAYYDAFASSQPAPAELRD